MPTTKAVPSTQTMAIDTQPSLFVYDTLSKRKKPFKTVEPDKVGIYLCGPTVYDKAHIGHMVGPVLFDCIKRYLAYCGYDVTWVVNITDVDDKLISKASERGISMLEVADENIADYRKNLAALGVDQIDHFPRATECMDDIVAFIESLVDQGFAYVSEGDVYFDVNKDGGYGKLSNRNIDALQGEGGAGSDRKRHMADFALWKGAKPDEPSWDSPWGNGRPGWHIECSAMSRKLLGKTFDIHGGGLDLVFPHHENEIAQSECCHSQPMVNYWMHNGLLRTDSSAGKIGGRADRKALTPTPPNLLDPRASPEDGGGEAASGKMSRSKGAGGLAELIGRQGGERIRFFLLRTHYRSTVLFSEPAVEESATGQETFYRFFKRFERVTANSFYDLETPKTRAAGEIAAGGNEFLEEVSAVRQKFLAGMDDDFNSGSAIGELFELARLLNKYSDSHGLETPDKNPEDEEAFVRGAVVMSELTGVLGLFQRPLAAGAASDALVDHVMRLVIELRTSARAAKNFAVADAIRDGLAPTGIVLEDRAGGTEWSGGRDGALDGVMRLLIDLRATARENKDFATADTIRDRLAELEITLEDRAGGTEWERN